MSSYYRAYYLYQKKNQTLWNVDHAVFLKLCISGMEGMGLFWSMQQSPGQSKGLRFMKLDVETPIVVDL